MELHSSLTGEKLELVKKSQKKMTNMFREYNNLCRKYGLTYWCIGGTLIGILRKDKKNDNSENIGGWIPFDMDIDVSMLDTDYEIFKTKAHELPKNMFLQDITTDKNYHIKNLAKIRDINSHYLDYTPKNCHKGLQIDIFIWNKSENTIHLKIASEKKRRFDLISTIFPVKEACFEDLIVYIPNDYILYAKNKCGGYPIPYLPIEKRLPHEGYADPENAHPEDVVMYPELYS